MELLSMDDEDEKVRYIATQIASIRRLETARSKLRDALYDPSPWIRIEAIRGHRRPVRHHCSKRPRRHSEIRQGEEVSAAQDALRSLTGIDYLIE